MTQRLLNGVKFVFLSVVAVATLLFAAVVTLLLAQRRPPPFVTSAELALGGADVVVFDRIASAPGANILVMPSDRHLALTTSDGADVLELFRIFDELGARVLRHASVNVRAYAAFRLLTRTPHQAIELLDTVTDDAPITLTVYDDPPVAATFGALTVAMACSQYEAAPAVRRFLRVVARDLRYLQRRFQAEACLEARGESLPLLGEVDPSRRLERTLLRVRKSVATVLGAASSL